MERKVNVVEIQCYASEIQRVEIQRYHSTMVKEFCELSRSIINELVQDVSIRRSSSAVIKHSMLPYILDDDVIQFLIIRER